MNPSDIAAVWSQTDRELWLLTVAAGERRGGLIATFVSNASIVPAAPRVLVGIAKRHFTWELIEAAGAFALHLLGEEHLDWVWRFGLESGRDRDKLAGIPGRTGASGSPVLNGVPAWLECRVEARMDAGDRTIYLAAVIDGGLERGGQPLTLKRMLAIAPPERLQQLKAHMARDAAADGRAIEAWRATQSGPS